MRFIHTSILFVSALALSHSAFAVDGVIEINQAKALAGGVTASDAPGFPVTIDAAGSYRLTSNLYWVGSYLAVEIPSSRVTLDLNGFQIYACVAISSAADFVAVVNGTIHALCPDTMSLGDRGRVDGLRIEIEGGISLGSECMLTNTTVSGRIPVGTGCLVSGNNFLGNVGDGVVAQGRSRILNNTFYNYEGSSIYVTGGNCIVSGNTVDRSYRYAIFADNCVIENNHVSQSGSEYSEYAAIRGHGSLIRGNVVEAGSASDSSAFLANDALVIGNVARNNTYYALVANAATGYKDNQFDNNNGGNANPQVSGGTEIGTNICGGDTTCP